jgi:hypothetical protein
MRRFVVLALLLFLSISTAQAQRVSPDEARRAGEAFLAWKLADEAGWGGRAAAAVTACQPLSDSGRVYAYWLPVAPAGHLIVSPLRQLPAIKAWSESDTFDPQQADGYPLLIRQVMTASLDFLAENYGSLDALPLDVAPAGNRESWAWLLEGGPSPRSRDLVGPLLTTSWHQEGPYWNDCPPGDGGQCLVGCVATSAAMIMRYWEYPLAGIGNPSYEWDGDNSCGGQYGGGLLQVACTDPYDWDNILNSYNSGYTPEQAAAVAELNHETAVAFQMDFGHCASGSYVSYGETVYEEIFDYRAGVAFRERSSYDQDGWWNLILSELQQVPPRPIQYRIYGHSIVCDGYQDNSGRYYHMNYGWGGGNNIWYALDNLFCNWTGCDVMEEGLLQGIEPRNYFAVSEPSAATIWTHGEVPALAIAWSGSAAAQVKIDLYKGDLRIGTVVDWTANDGSEPLGYAVPASWGTGANFRLKVVGDDIKFGWSATFGIYGAGGWTEATGGGPLGDTGNGQGLAWGDCDGDGWPDIYLTNETSGNRLFGNQAGLAFTDVTAAPLNVAGHARGAAWADIDNDGDLDLYLAQTTGHANYLFRNDGGSFTDITAGPLGDTSYSSDCAWGDYDGDGLVDLFIVNAYAADKLLRNEGGGVFTNATTAPLGDAGWGRSAAWGDYDGDGDLDLYLVRNNANKLYRNNGGGSFTDVTGATGTGDAGVGYGAAWGDCDNDGDLDLYITNQGANVLLRNDGGVFSNVSASPIDDAGAGRGAAWGDYDNDGWLDLYLCNNDGGNKLFRNLGDGSFGEATDPLLGDESASQSAGFADFDGDGDLDLYLVNSDSANRLFRNENGGPHWLQIDLEGTDSNRCGIGAWIHLRAGGQDQYRQVGGDAGYLSRNSLTAAFGLGDAASLELLEIRWPNGTLISYPGIAVDQRHLLSEEATAVSEGAAPGTLRLGSHPNPFNPSTTLAFSLPVPAPVELAIYDLSGRCLRVLAKGVAYPAGEHTLRWDGRDAEGRALSSGVYFGRLQAAGQRASLRLLLLK